MGQTVTLQGNFRARQEEVLVLRISVFLSFTLVSLVQDLRYNRNQEIRSLEQKERWGERWEGRRKEKAMHVEGLLLFANRSQWRMQRPVLPKSKDSVRGQLKGCREK